METNYGRPAIAMIELIFAIVIMGIVMMSAPMLISTAKKTVDVALQQEGINEAVSRITMVLTHEWDEIITREINASNCAPILHVAVGDSELNMTANGKRIGVDDNSSGRSFRCGIDEFNASVTLGSETGEKDDIDDFAATSLALDTNGTGGIDYIEQTTVNIATSVYYSTDERDYNNSSVDFDFNATAPSPPLQSTNIKTIAVTLTSSSGEEELNKTITMSAFSCNTGNSLDFEHRTFP